MSTTLNDFFNDIVAMDHLVKRMESYKPYLYILMRDDMASMNPGKAVAQGAHAANSFVYTVASQWDTLSTFKKELYLAWQGSTTQGFGVTICLSVNEQQLRGAVAMLQSADVLAGITHDPGYPIQDGSVLHTIPLDTCGWVFGSKPELAPLLAQYPLHP